MHGGFALLPFCLVTALCSPVSAQSGATRRVEAAAELQRRFDQSLVKNWALQFVAARCEL